MEASVEIFVYLVSADLRLAILSDTNHNTFVIPFVNTSLHG